MDAPDRPLAASLEFLRGTAAWGDGFRLRMVAILEARDEPYHRQAAAATLYRLPNLCRAVILLSEADLPDEAVSIVRVIAELAINAAWVGTDEKRAWSLALDFSDATSRGEAARLKHLGMKPMSEPLPGAKRLPPLQTRAEQAGQDALAVHSIYDILSGPTHSALPPLAHLDADTRTVYGRGVAGLGVQAASRLVGYVSKNLGITEGVPEVNAALVKWTASAR